MVTILNTNSSTCNISFDFLTSYTDGNVIQSNFRQDYMGRDEDSEFLEIMRSVADQFDKAFRKLAD